MEGIRTSENLGSGRLCQITDEQAIGSNAIGSGSSSDALGQRSQDQAPKAAWRTRTHFAILRPLRGKTEVVRVGGPAPANRQRCDAPLASVGQAPIDQRLVSRE